MKAFAALLLSIVLSGCAATAPFDRHLESTSVRVRDCAQWYAALDQAVDDAGVRDAQQARMAGFPYLRIDRPLAGLRERAARSNAAFSAYVERLAELDLEARQHEIRNLGLAPEVSLQRTRGCGALLRELDLAKQEARNALLAKAEVPPEYSLFHRLVGLYPLTRVAFAAGIRRWEAETVAEFSRDAAEEGAWRIVYAPPASAPVSRRAVAALLARAAADPLGEPRLSERELAPLYAHYAPSFEVAVRGDFDRFGELRWRRGEEAITVDAAQPTVYVHPAYTRYGETVLLQLVYTIWFSERPARSAVDHLAGRLDGITWRVTLAPDGEPIIYDAIHPCGCYHLFIPTPRARPRPSPDVLEEWAFVPQTLPRVLEGERPVLSLESGTHYIRRLTLVQGTDSLTRYALRPYDELRSLAHPHGGHRSAFGPDGLVAGSERLERWIFWPMGIPSAGAMRQWGRHATAFVGRRHFDDADLFERRFELELGAP